MENLLSIVHKDGLKVGIKNNPRSASSPLHITHSGLTYYFHLLLYVNDISVIGTKSVCINHFT